MFACRRIFVKYNPDSELVNFITCACLLIPFECAVETHFFKKIIYFFSLIVSFILG